MGTPTPRADEGRVDDQRDAGDNDTPAIRRSVEKPTYMITSAYNALVLLATIRDQGGLRLKEAAQELGVADSTAHRLLTTLTYSGFVVQDSTRRYVAGPLMGVGPAPTSTHRLLRKAALPEMGRLTQTTGETANVMVRTGKLARTIASVESPRLLRIGSRLGHVTDAWRAAGGKALLAELNPETVDALGDETNPSPEFIQQLDTIKQRGYATSIDEVEAGLSSIAVCLRQRGHAVGALVLALPSTRFKPGVEPRLVKYLQRAADRINASLDTLDAM